MGNRETASFLAILFGYCILLVGLVGCDGAVQNKLADAAGSSVNETVAVSIEFGGRRADKHFLVPCFEGPTVLSILDLADDRGEIKINYRGSGETAFVESIDAVVNEGANGDNWVYRVNGKLADRSCGEFEVKSDDEIVWTLGPYKPDDK